MQKLRREEIEKLSSLSVSSFDTMELRYYPNTMDEKLGEPVRTYMGNFWKNCVPTQKNSTAAAKV